LVGFSSYGKFSEMPKALTAEEQKSIDNGVVAKTNKFKDT